MLLLASSDERLSVSFAWREFKGEIEYEKCLESKVVPPPLLLVKSIKNDGA